jgi:hypothetical protein
MGKPDTAFQARVNHLNMDHVHRLAGCYDLDGKLSPVVIFRAVDGRKTRMILADGFHRHEVHRRKGVPAIRAYVIDVAMDRIEHEARLFASMCNQVTLLARTDKDKRKAVELLFADSETWLWADNRIAKHCGVAQSSVRKYRTDYSVNNRRKLPEKTIKSDGTTQNYRHEKPENYIYRQPQCRGGKQSKTRYRFYKTIKGKYVHLGTTEDSAREKLNEITEYQDNHRVKLTRNIERDFFACRGLSFNSCEKTCGNRTDGIAGHHGHGLIYVVTEFQDKRDIPVAIGTLRLLRLKMNMLDARLVILCYPEDGPQDLIEWARQDGIEFFMPEGLVANLKGTESQEEKEPEGDLPCT